MAWHFENDGIGLRNDASIHLMELNLQDIGAQWKRRQTSGAEDLSEMAPKNETH